MKIKLMLNQKLLVFLLITSCMPEVHARDYFPMRPSTAQVAAYVLASGSTIACMTTMLWHGAGDYIFQDFAYIHQEFHATDFTKGYIKGALLSMLPSAVACLALRCWDKQKYPMEQFGLLVHSTAAGSSMSYGLSNSVYDVWSAVRDYRYRVKYLQLLKKTPKEPKGNFNKRFSDALIEREHEDAWQHAEHVFRHIPGGDVKVDVAEGDSLVESNNSLVQQWQGARRRAKAESDSAYLSYTCGQLAGALSSVAAIGGAVGWALYNFVSSK